MTYPSYSFLAPATLEMALQLARELRQASSEVGRLTNGGAAVAYNYSGGGGRVGDKAIAVKDWIGPHHDTFEMLFANESESARETEERLVDEADAWAEFWATATNARNARLYDEALDRYHDAMAIHRERVQEFHDAQDAEPGTMPIVSLPGPPSAPAPKPPVAVPTAATEYAPTE